MLSKLKMFLLFWAWFSSQLFQYQSRIYPQKEVDLIQIYEDTAEKRICPVVVFKKCNIQTKNEDV